MLRQYFTVLILSFVLLSAANCKKDPETPMDLSSLENKLWLHSYEEDSADVTTYRPDDFNFPPSRGRKGFKVLKDSVFILYAIAPTDGWQKHNGKWKVTENKFFIATFDNQSIPPKRWEVKEVSQDLIKLKEIKTEEN